MATNANPELGALELFTGCGARLLRRIHSLAFTLDVEAGRPLCREGEPGAEFFVLVSGVAEVRGRNGTVALLHPGAWFGETALLSDAPRRATVTTRTKATVLVFGRREFGALLSLAPHIRSRLCDTTSRVSHGGAPTRLPWYQPLPSNFPIMTFDKSGGPNNLEAR